MSLDKYTYVGIEGGSFLESVSMKALSSVANKPMKMSPEGFLPVFFSVTSI